MERRLSSTVDLYALAVTYVELRTGRRPFEGHWGQILDAQRAGTPRLEGLGRHEAAVVRQALAPNPEERPKGGAVAWVRSLREAIQQDKQAKPAPSPGLSGTPGEHTEVGNTGGSPAEKTLVGAIGAIGGASYGANYGAIVVGAMNGVLVEASEGK